MARVAVNATMLPASCISTSTPIMPNRPLSSAQLLRRGYAIIVAAIALLSITLATLLACPVTPASSGSSPSVRGCEPPPAFLDRSLD